MLITFVQAKAHLNVDHDSDNDLIQEKIEQASDIILDYCKLPADSWQDTGGTPVNVPPLVRCATCLAVGTLYENRMASTADVLSQPVRDLLHRYRDPAIA